MIYGILAGTLVFVLLLIGLYIYCLYNYITKLHKMINQALLEISNKFIEVEKEVETKIGLKPGEKLAATTLHFKGVDIAKGDNDEPLDSITVLEYSVNNENKERRNE